MLKIDQKTAQELLNAIVALANTLPVSQATVLSTLVSQLGKAFEAVPEESKPVK